MAAPTVTAGDRPVPGTPAGPGRGRVLARTCAAGGAGALLFVAAPPRELWWLAPVAFAVLWLVLATGPAPGTGGGSAPVRMRAGLGYGFAFGLGFFVPLLPWVGEFVGPVPWLALAAVEALVLGLAGAGVAAVTRLPVAPLFAAGWWVAAEALIARVPFGGFPWGRVAFGQPSGVFLPVASVGGPALLTAAVVLTGFAAGELVRRGVPALRGATGARALVVPVLLAAVPVLAGVALAPLVGTAAQQGTVQVALIQGNVPRMGLDFNAQRRAVLDNHVAQTRRLAADVAAGRRPQPQLVIWPENSSDIDPLRHADARAAVDAAARAVGAPIVVGAVLSPATGGPTNTLIVWDPHTGPGERQDKRRLQPFGEYMPYREFFRLFNSYVDRASNFVPGGGDGALDVGPARVGVATCYEVVFDDVVRQSVRSGAQLLAVPTNNATFGLTDMTYQQQAISRVRAVEHGRAVLVAATSGSSAVIAPDGSVRESTGLFTPATLVAQVPLRTGTTLATRLGAGPETALAAMGAVGVLAALVTAPGGLTRRAVRTNTQRAGADARR